MKGVKVIHPQSLVVKRFIEHTPDFSLEQFLIDMGVKQEQPEASKNFIGVSAAMKLLDVSRAKFYGLVKSGDIELHYIAGDPHNTRVKETDILGLMTTEKHSEVKTSITKANNRS